MPDMPKANVLFASFIVSGLLLLSGCGTTGSPSLISTISQCSLTEEEISHIKQQAEAGDAEAQFRVAGWFQKGHCLPKDYSEAMDWYRRAADQGHPEAQYKLARMYLNDKDVKKAEEWYLKAAVQGYRPAQYDIAYKYLHGSELPKDVNKAEQWYRRAAEQGHAFSARTLGDIYYLGKYKPKDLDKAEKWYRLAAEHGDTYSRRHIDDIARKTEQRKSKEKELELQRREAQEYAQKATARFGSVSISVIEEAQSKLARAEIRKKLGSLPESPKQTEQFTEGDLVEGTLYMAPYFGPFAPIAVLFLAIGDQVDQSIKEWKSVSFEDKAKIKSAIVALTETFAQANPEKDLMAELQATAVRQQAPSLLGIDSGDVASDAPYQLVVQLEQLQIVQSPNSRHYGHLWAATAVELTSRKGVDAAVEKRICYMSPPFSFVGVATNSTLEFQERISNAYQNLSSQILSEVLGLAPDADIPSPSRETVKWCESAIVSIKVAGGYYTGEMKDGKRHGSGEMRYAKGNWLTIYRGNFVNDKEHGEGRCKLARGDWMRCTYSNGSRVATY